MPGDANTVRIFVVGESAAQGFPQPRPLKYSSFLQVMLADIWPQRHVEVVNLSATAIASFPVAHLARAALDYAPDLLIVYTGNNEFYGAGGVASTHRLGRSVTGMKVFHEMGRSALIQAVRARRAPAVVIGENQTLMDVVIADAQIPPDDARRAAAARNLGDNIRNIIDESRAAGVPVIVCTCPGNERDLAPIGVDAKPPLEEEALRAFRARLMSATADRLSAPAKALETLEFAALSYDRHARLNYLRGQCLLSLNRVPEAASAFRRARDLDPMPWRCTSPSNEATRSAARGGATLCDLELAFQQASPNHAIGWELMDDHVHPSLAGQVLIARTLLRAMSELPEGLRVDERKVAALPDWETYARRQGANPLDAYFVVDAMTDLFERSFYRASNPDALIRFQAQRSRMTEAMSPATLAAVRKFEESRSSGPITGAVGEAEFLAGNYRAAAELCALARHTQPQFSFLAIRYACLEVEARRRAGSAGDESAALERIIKICRVSHVLRPYFAPRLNAFHGWAMGRSGRHEDAIALLEPAIRHFEDPLRPMLVAQLVTDLVTVGRAADARAILSELRISAADLPVDSEISAQLYDKK
jgi:tetratricopeptide (TPR) repeat protein